jgi:hypothetical protein
MQEGSVLSFEKDDAEKLSFVEFTCPQCFKLQKAPAIELKSPKNFFRCVRCDTLFCFDWPAVSGKAVKTLIVPEDSERFYGLIKKISSFAKVLDMTSQGETLEGLPIALRRSSKIAKIEKVQKKPRKIFFKVPHWLVLKNQDWFQKASALPWPLIMDRGLWVVPALFIITGVLFVSYRNFIGIGVSLIGLRIGLTILLK